MVEQSKGFSLFMYKYMEKMELGTVGKTASEFGVSRQQFYKWLNGGIPLLQQLRNIVDVISSNTDISRAALVVEVVEILHSSLKKKAG